MRAKTRCTLIAVWEAISFRHRAGAPWPALGDHYGSWAKVVSSCPDIPGIYKSFFDALPAEERDPFPYTVLTPRHKGQREPENEELVCHTGKSIYILEKIEGRLVCTSFPLAGISCVENGVILLHSWITIRGMNGQGVPTSSTLTFNSVTDHVMAPFVECMRPAVNTETATHVGADASGLSLPSEVSLKFGNYAERSIRPGERVMQTILQPEIRGEGIRLFGLSLSKSISPAHLTVLTDSELIHIRDDDSQRWMNGSPHGGIWTFIPLGKIASVSVSSQGKDLLVLSIHPLGDVRFSSVFLASRKGELELLQQQLQGSASAINSSAARSCA